MIGTINNRNILHRLGDALNAYKGLPAPAQLYPSQQGIQTGYLTFPGWNVLEQNTQGNSQDEQRVRKALQSPTVFANVQAIANEIASAELIIKERTDDGLEDVDNHPLELLWEAPNPYMGRSFLASYWAWSYTLASRAYLYWLPAGGEIQEVWPIPPFMIKPIPSGKDFIGGYLFKARADADAIPIPPEYITYSHSVNLFDMRDGLSFLSAAMVDINSEIAESLWNQNFFSEQNGIPDGLLGVNKDTLDVDLMRIRQELRDFFGGTKRGIAVARAGEFVFSQFGRSQKDVEFKEGLNIASQRIGRAMGFPDGYWSDIANRANAEQARATMIAGAVWPLLVRLHEDLNAGVVRRWYGEQYRAEFKDIRPEDRALKLQELTFYAQVETVDELRKRIGDDEIGDVRGSMLIAEIAKGVPTPTSAPSQEQEEFLAEQEAEAAPEEPTNEPPPPPEGQEAATEAAPPAQGEAPLTAAPAEGVSMKSIPVYHVPQYLQDIAATNPDDVVLNGTGGEAPRSIIYTDPYEADLDKWERKALKSLKRFHVADVKFETNTIPLDEQVRIHTALKSAQTPADVARAFKAADEPDATDALIGAEWDGAVAWAKAAKEGKDG